MNSKMTINSQLSTIGPGGGKKTQTSKLSKQQEQKQNHRNGDHMEGYEQGRGGVEWGKRYRK